MDRKDLQDMLVSAASGKGSGAGDSAAQPPADAGGDGMDDLSREIETLRTRSATTQRPDTEHRHHSQGHQSNTFDEFAYQEYRSQTELSVLSSEITALDGLIEIDKMRLEEIQASLQRNIAAKARMQHLHDAKLAFLESLRVRPN